MNEPKRASNSRITVWSVGDIDIVIDRHCARDHTRGQPVLTFTDIYCLVITDK